MKVAVLSDIHGNHDALDAIMQSRDFADVEKIFVLGDTVGYYYEPDKVLAKLNQYSVELIVGNHDLFLKQDQHHNLEKLRGKYGKGIEVALQKLSQLNLSQIIDAPDHKIVNIDNVKCYLCHGSPWKIDEYIYPDAPIEKLASCADFAIAENCNFLFMGHTHYPFVFYHNGCVVSNPGSVGQARDKGGFACWQLLDTVRKVLIQKRTPYKIDRLKQDIQTYDPDMNYLANVLVRE